MQRAIWAVALWLAAEHAYAQAPAADAPLGKNDFAYAMELQIEPGTPVQTLLVPLEVYRGALTPDLADIRVLDGSGLPVAHALRSLPARTRVENGERGVPLFPLYAETPATKLEDLTLHVERSPTGTVIDVHSTNAAGQATRPDAGQSHVVAYILDLSALEHDVVALQLKTAQVQESYVVPITIEASDDLARFTPVAREVALARLMHDGQEVLRDQIELPRTRAKFLRVRWHLSELPTAITAATVALAPGEALQENSVELRLSGTVEKQATGGAHVHSFDLGGALEVERVQVVLGPSSVAQVALSAADADPPGLPRAPALAARAYAPLYEGQLYHLTQNGQSLTSPAIDVERRRYRYFALRELGGSAPLEPAPELIVRYAPAQLVFVPRGAGPFTLAYGSHRARPSRFDAEALLSALGAQARAALPIATAKLGAQKTLAGKDALAPPPPPPPIKTYVLWAVLIVSAGALAVLSIRLLRKLD